MAKRVNRPNHTDETREKIKTSQLINRLQNHALGKVDLKNGQIKSIEILLRKTLPDLTATELKGGVSVNKVISAEPMSENDWENKYSGGLEATGRATESAD